MDWGTIALVLLIALVIAFVTSLLERWTKHFGPSDTSGDSDAPWFPEHHQGGAWGHDNGSGGHHGGGGDGGGGGHH